MSTDNKVIANNRWSAWNTDSIEMPLRIGNKPPQPNLVSIENKNRMYAFAETIIDTDNYGTVTGIVSAREPYAQEELMTKYGNLESRVGTNLGR
jgi:hypothetical protein